MFKEVNIAMICSWWIVRDFLQWRLFPIKKLILYGTIPPLVTELSCQPSTPTEATRSIFFPLLCTCEERFLLCPWYFRCITGFYVTTSKLFLFLTIIGIRAAEHFYVYNFLLWKGPSFCDRVPLNFSPFARRGIKPVGSRKKIVIVFWSFRVDVIWILYTF